DSKRAFIRAMKQSPSPALRVLADGRERLIRLLDQEERPNAQLQSVDGQTIDLKSLRGRIVLIHFWSIHCSSCIKEMSNIKAVYDRYGPFGLRILGVCMTGRKDEEPRIREILRKNEVSWPQVLQRMDDPASLWKRFSFTVLGEQLLLDQDGYLVANELND